MARARKDTGASKLKALDRLAERWDAKKSAMDDVRSDLGVLGKEVEDAGFNRRAFKECMRLRNMEPDKRNDYLSSLNAVL